MLRNFFKTCLGCGCAVFLVFWVIVVGLCLLGWQQYRVWEDENSILLESFGTDSNVGIDLEEKLMDFGSSQVQLQSMELSCEEVEVLFRDAIVENWDMYNVDSVGVICGDRSLDVYVHVKGGWFVIELWQTAEGALDFAVVDVSWGPVSLGELSWGYVNAGMSEGIGDAVDLVSQMNFSGRRITEIYVREDGVLVTGGLPANL